MIVVARVIVVEKAAWPSKNDSSRAVASVAFDVVIVPRTAAAFRIVHLNRVLALKAA